jgi:nitroreductase/NAD-dependent dihydropyrimidine dehydrogenase PreA subunit
MVKISVDPKTCVRCGACVALCTADVFALTETGAEAVSPETCWRCGHCVAACPVDAIEHSAFPLEECPLIDPSQLPSVEQLAIAFRERRSNRVFKREPVPRGLVEELLDATRWTPSASNARAVRWLVIDEPERIAAFSRGTVAALGHLVRLIRNPFLWPVLRLILDKEGTEKARRSASSYHRLTERLARGEDPIFFHAPVLLIAHGRKWMRFERDDAIYSTYNLMLAAQRLGLGTCQIGFFQFALSRSRRLRRALGLPKGRRTEIALVLGYPKFPFRRALPRRGPKITWSAPRES